MPPRERRLLQDFVKRHASNVKKHDRSRHLNVKGPDVLRFTFDALASRNARFKAKVTFKQATLAVTNYPRKIFRNFAFGTNHSMQKNGMSRLSMISSRGNWIIWLNGP
jgi:hypothetical protein